MRTDKKNKNGSTSRMCVHGGCRFRAILDHNNNVVKVKLKFIDCKDYFILVTYLSMRQHVTYKDHVTNEEVRAKIQQAIGPHEDLLTIVERRKLLWYGHVSRSSGLAKTILQGTVKGARRQGGQRKRWEDNIREWTGLEFGKSQRAVENREKWRKLVAESSVVPQRPSRLRD